MKPDKTPALAARPAPEPAAPLYAVEALAAHAANLMTIGVFFYTAYVFGWGAGRNLLLAASLGTVFTLGALSAQRATARLGLRTTLMLALSAMALSAGVAAAGRSSPQVLVVALLCHMLGSSFVWTSLESLVCTGLTHEGMARRLAVYNVVWPGVSAVTVAMTGAVIGFWPPGLFLLPAIVDASAVLVLVLTRPRAESGGGGGATIAADDDSHDARPAVVPPDVLRVRTRALWLSRIALPSTFVVANGLMAIVPSLPLIARLDPEFRTLAAGVWLAARWGGFFYFGWTTWWHARPLTMLAATVMMLLAFLGITLPWPFPNFVDPGTAGWLAWIIGWQLVLGLCLALIYSASLYFGMVLSEASAEHSGYHEALIGLGTILGPGAGAAAQFVSGVRDPTYGAAAVASVVAVSVVAAGVVAARSPGPGADESGGDG